MRLCWANIICAVLAAGNVVADLTPMSTVTIESCSDLPMTVRTNMDDVHGCYLVTPDGTEIEFMPEDKSSDRYELRDPAVLFGCQANIKHVDENDEGIWELYYVSDTGTKGSQYYNVTVITNENAAEGDSEEVTDELKDTTHYYPTISYGARMDIDISISLSKKSYTEECYLRTPQGDAVDFKEVDIEGVTVYAASSDFTSCRVVIGPMTEDLIGTWTLCGKHVEGQSTLERCQLGNIAWAISNPSANWASTEHHSFSHVVHFGGRISPAVRGSGTLNTCHVITPKGEDIVVTADSDYPGLQFNVLREATICNITMFPIDAHFLGDWSIYGTFHANAGFNVVTQPLNLFLYDEENPHNQAYNISNLNVVSEVVNVGNIFIVQVAGNGNARDDCVFMTNNGEQYGITSLEAAPIPGLAIVNANNNIHCRFQIGPVTESMKGEWRLIGKFRRSTILYNEIQQPLNIIIDDPSNPIQDDSRTVEYLNPQAINTTFGESHAISTATGNRITTDSCHIRTPDGLQYILRDGLTVPGVEIVTGSGISCGVRIRVNTREQTGDWMLIARLTNNGVRIERRQPFSIHVEEAAIEVGPESEEGASTEDEGEETTEENIPEIQNITNWLPTIRYGARIDVEVSITLSKKSYAEKCNLRTPLGDVIQLEDVDIPGVHVYPTSSEFVSCRIVIGPMNENLLGTWTLCGQHTEGEQTIERCQPGYIAWATSDPTANWASTTHASFDHVVHFGGTLTPIVRGTGTLNTCHVVTPNGEDIVVTADSDYPGLEFIVHREATICTIAIGPIESQFLGDWALYGTYNSNFGFNLVRLPMHLFLYDVDNPYHQAYNVSYLGVSTHVVNLGNTFMVEALGVGNRRDDCIFITNTGQRVDQDSLPSANMPEVDFVNVNNRVSCRLQIGPISENMLGQWTLIGKFSRNNLIFDEVQLPIDIIQEDPANPIPDDSRQIENLNAQNIYTTFGATHQVTTASGSNVATDSCHIRTPDNLQYTLMEGFNVPGVTIVTGSGITCGVRLQVESEDMIGEWMLIARLNIRGNLVERRQPFTINVEVDINATPSETHIAEGNDLYLRLENPSSLPDTCTIVGPARTAADVDTNFAEYCGFIVKDVTTADGGQWTIVYGDKVKYKALVRVTVVARSSPPVDSKLFWTKDASVNETIGPEDAVYCRIESPNGLSVFEGFGRCKIVQDRVTQQHVGVWKMIVATTGRVLPDTYEFEVALEEIAPKATVTTSVKTEKPLVMMSCQLAGDHAVTGCKFRDPAGKVLLATQGVGEDRYTFHGNTASVESNVTAHSCGLRFTDPVTTDLGLWRCAMETTQDTHYGFLSVLCPWAMSVPEIAATVVSEPTLAAETDSLTAVEGDMVTMRCSVQAAIRYCYFRAQNGSVFNVGLGSSGEFEYPGAGLDAGECSVRFPSLLAADSGRWSCHVGFQDPKEPEQRAQIALTVEALMVAQQHHLDNPRNTLVVQGQVHSHRSLDYCRFVRIDGYGFTSENVPSNYVDHSTPATGHCEIRADDPTVLEQHPWTVVARLSGRAGEVARSTGDTLQTPSTDAPPQGTDVPPTEVHPPTEAEEHPVAGASSAFLITWSCVLVVSLLLFFVGVMLGPKKNRDWTFRRASIVRNSLRNSITKKPLPIDENNLPNEPNTPMAA